MRMTLYIDDILIDDLLELTQEKSTNKAVTIAITEYIKKKKFEMILSYQGNLEIKDNWERLEKEEMEDREEKKF